jgi:DNA-binding transcriptional LysR family regulator
VDIELRHLRSFLVVAEELNFTRAAAELRVTQPSLTRTIRKLEEILGVRLFDRNTRRVVLTPPGERLKTELSLALRRLDDALWAHRGTVSLRLGFTWLLPDGWAQQAVARFESATGTRVDLVRRDEPLAGVESGAVDVAVLRGAVPDHNLLVIPLFTEPRVAAVSKASPLAKRDSIGWTEFVDWPLVINEVSGTTRTTLWPQHSRPPVGVVCQNYDEWQEAVAADHGVGIIAKTAQHRGVHPAIRFVPIDGAPPVQVVLVYPRHGAHPLAARFAAIAYDLDPPDYL